MKYSKVAAVVAGSVIAVGVGTPAFAAGRTTTTPATSAMPTNLNAGVDQLMAAQPLEQAIAGTHLDSALQTAANAAGSLKSQTTAADLVGRATGAAHGAALSTITGALPGASLLGGLPLGG